MKQNNLGSRYQKHAWEYLVGVMIGMNFGGF